MAGFRTRVRWQDDPTFNLDTNFDYLHSSVKTFYHQMQKNSLSSSVDTSILNMKKPYEEYKKTILQWFNQQIIKLRSIELNYTNQYHSELKGDTKAALANLNEKFTSDTTSLSLVKDLKVNLLKSNKDAKEKSDPAKELKAIAVYKNQIESIIKRLEGLITLYNKSKGIKGKNHANYTNSVNQLRDLISLPEIKAITEKNAKPTRDQLKVAFIRLIQNDVLKSVGYLTEVVAGDFIQSTLADKNGKLDVRAVGAKYASSFSVVDLTFGSIKETNPDKIYGVNIKSTAKQYTLTRTNKIEDMYKDEKFIGLHQDTMDQKSWKHLVYFLRNYIALNQFSNDISAKDVIDFKHKQELITSMEAEIVKLYNLSSVLDTYYFQSKLSMPQSDKIVHSVLLFFPSGFYWTSDIMEAIIKEIDNKKFSYIGLTLKENSLRKTEVKKLKNIFKEKRASLQKRENPSYAKLHSDLQNSFNSVIPTQKDLFAYSLIDRVHYHIKIASIAESIK